MNKEIVYKNMFKMINDGFFLDKYIELTEEQKNWNYFYNEDSDNAYEEQSEFEKFTILEEIATNIFNAILLGCQLFDDEEKIKKFVNKFSLFKIDYEYFEFNLSLFNITKTEALERLKHGFCIHFTTPKIAAEIKKQGKLLAYGKNGIFTEEEDKIITEAAQEQKNNDRESEKKLKYLFRGWGTGLSSYSSTANHFWMYHTPESLTFLYGDISKRNKEESMKHILENISALSQKNKEITYNTMSNIYDRLIGDEQDVCCILIDRDIFEYEVIYYYDNDGAEAVEKRPFNNVSNFIDLIDNDQRIINDINVNDLKFLTIPTVLKLEQQKEEKMQQNNSFRRM